MSKPKGPSPALMALLKAGDVGPGVSHELDGVLLRSVNAMLTRRAVLCHQPFEPLDTDHELRAELDQFLNVWEPVLMRRSDIQWVKCPAPDCLYNQWAAVDRSAPVVCPHHPDKIIDLPFYTTGKGTIILPCGACNGKGRIQYTHGPRPWSVKCQQCGGDGNRRVSGLPRINDNQPYEPVFCYACERELSGAELGLATLSPMASVAELGIDGTPLTHARRMDLTAKLAVHRDNLRQNQARRTICVRHIGQYEQIIAAIEAAIEGADHILLTQEER